MAALESAFGEEVMADINLSLDRENLTATEYSEFQFNANSSTGQSQLCILEPHITEIVDNDLAIGQLTTAENVALEDSVNTEAVWEYPWQSDKVVANLSGPHQDENISVKDEEANSQSSKQINYHDIQNKNLYFCDRLKDFQQPPVFAQHNNVFCASKVPMQSKQLNWKQLQICNPLVPDQNSQTKNCLIDDQCGENNQSISHLSHDKNALPNENSAGQHQNSQSETSSLISEACYRSKLVPALLQAENMIENVDEAVDPNSRQVTNQRTETKNLHICDQCGKEYQWLSELIQHQLLFFGREADRQCQLHMDGGNPNHLAPAPIPFQENSKIPIEQKNYAKNLYNFNTDQNDFQCHHLLMKYPLPVPLGGKADTQNQFKIQAGSLSQFQMESKVIESSETLKLWSNLTTNQSFHINSLRIYKECGKDFQWSSALAQYKVVHSEKVSGKQCLSKVDDHNDSSLGLMDFDQPPHLKINQLTEKNKPYACGHCGKNFKWPSDLARHKHIHCRKKLMTGKGTKSNKSYICSQCGKNFQWPEVAQHKCTHSRKKLLRGKGTKLNKYYTRSQCRKNFQSLSQLAQHKHTNSRNKLVKGRYSRLIKACICDQCGKGFKWPSDLARHKRTHSRKRILRDKGIKLSKYYTCNQCRKSFQLPSDLARHEQIHARSRLVTGTKSKLKGMSELEKSFLRFSAYGETTTHRNTMSRKNFYKMLKECGVMDGKIMTGTDVLIAFNEIKFKGANHINYVEFLQAIKFLSRKCFKEPSQEEALQAMLKLMEGKKPSNLEE
ncbi:tubulin polymerization-promoting protein family member 2 isoform X2 [Erythrolamprus reginae]|uniref:tubulin polymerization-promoting protein family member 2 isoform X2 n=1 Tax=Erythrolamprus reginae TaxID=121349 RepID=UPI00396C6858